MTSFLSAKCKACGEPTDGMPCCDRRCEHKWRRQEIERHQNSIAGHLRELERSHYSNESEAAEPKPESQA